MNDVVCKVMDAAYRFQDITGKQPYAIVMERDLYEKFVREVKVHFCPESIGTLLAFDGMEVVPARGNGYKCYFTLEPTDISE